MLWWPALPPNSKKAGSIPGSVWRLHVPPVFVLDLCGCSGTSKVFACVSVDGGSVMNWHIVQGVTPPWPQDSLGD